MLFNKDILPGSRKAESATLVCWICHPGMLNLPPRYAEAASPVCWSCHPSVGVGATLSPILHNRLYPLNSRWTIYLCPSLWSNLIGLLPYISTLHYSEIIPANIFTLHKYANSYMYIHPPPSADTLNTGIQLVTYHVTLISNHRNCPFTSSHPYMQAAGSTVRHLLPPTRPYTMTTLYVLLLTVYVWHVHCIGFLAWCSVLPNHPGRSRGPLSDLLGTSISISEDAYSLLTTLTTYECFHYGFYGIYFLPMPTYYHY